MNGKTARVSKHRLKLTIFELELEWVGFDFAQTYGGANGTNICWGERECKAKLPELRR